MNIKAAGASVPSPMVGPNYGDLSYYYFGSVAECRLGPQLEEQGS